MGESLDESRQAAFEDRLAARLDEPMTGDPSDFFLAWSEVKKNLDVGGDRPLTAKPLSGCQGAGVEPQFAW
ncbi:MAG: hypothetical protein QOJ60_1353 [Actinomycetota bacterium]|jgi:hypothetical protein|nr:hypothetical protein [Actinomycetota bacterium]